jgi:hypothetical protein
MSTNEAAALCTGCRVDNRWSRIRLNAATALVRLSRSVLMFTNPLGYCGRRSH